MSSILVTIWITFRIQESEVRNPHSLDYRKSYPTDFDEILWRAGVWPRDQLITFWWRSASLSGSVSPFRITIRIREELPRCQHTHRKEMGYLVRVLVLGCDVLVPIKTANVPASSSPVKRMFSQGETIRPHSARMSDKLFSQLILLKYYSDSRKPTWCIVTNDLQNITRNTLDCDQSNYSSRIVFPSYLLNLAKPKIAIFDPPTTKIPS